MEVVDLAGTGAGATGKGVVWSLGGEAQLNANLVHLDPGQEIGEHVNGEVDVMFVGVAGGAVLTVDGEQAHLAPQVLAFAPRGAARAVRAGSEPAAYLTVHRRRGGLGIRGTGGP